MPLPLIPLAAGAAGVIRKALRRRNNPPKLGDDRLRKRIETIEEEVEDRLSEPAEKGSPTAKSASLFNIAVTSEPPGAQIRVDGDYLSDTPFEVPLTPGKHKITIKIEGRKPWQDTVKVIKDGQQIHAKLKKSWL
jgi:hypothetical protein